MKIEIWSDIVCPWCYIGKRRFEKALAQFKYADEVTVEFKSYELNPDVVTNPNLKISKYLSTYKGIPIEQVESMNEHVTKTAETEGLNYQLDKVFPTNTFKAHRLLHLAKEKGLQFELKEALMNAYFVEAKNVDDHANLLQIAISVGLDEMDVQNVLTTEMYKANVQRDIEEGIQLGLQGVPFFVIDRKYGISGAQSTDTFLQSLLRAYAESE
ncbi:DsbA family oxidoreductase [Paracrocinitomix mangrovi]|uniref:DsbA family oxidoreductase n=1 Tax=Paracrocinitomix mangrovi TaxID=2862509 RepID=UPI001C8EA792|nr:DsbA family oxidoreductase [Paracrocinitomix mangrovi]UKN01206.1 DsbA family oxidoreductase [Paracrocinitomix mangrovi]